MLENKGVLFSMPKKKTTEQFIADARAVHGDKYDYSKVEYVNSNTKVRITCPIHGEFWQTPLNHIHGKQNCPECGELIRRKKRATGVDAFIKTSRSIFGDKYDYSKITNYTNNKANVEIICPIHGPFNRRVFDHTVMKRGCPVCDAIYSHSIAYGVGINDVYMSNKIWEMQLWHNMLHRCYNENFKKDNPTYQDCIVCDDWLIASHFLKWAQDPKNHYHRGYTLDKDILIKGNKVYSPDTCCFVPSRINTLIINRTNFRGPYPIGVTQNNEGFAANYNRLNKRTYIGTYPTVEEAFLAYKSAKEAYIKEVAEYYHSRDLIADNVYHALLRWEIAISD